MYSMHQLSLKITLVAFLTLFIVKTTKRNGAAPNYAKVPPSYQADYIYERLHLSEMGLKQLVFNKALVGLNVLTLQNQLIKKGIVSIVDFSQSANAKRLYIIDLTNEKVVYNTYVAHGRNSGEEFAVSFANKVNSYKSSLGFYITENTYQGAHGLSMRIKGIEKGINDDALSRGIVMHGADYVSESFIKNCGRLGRSQGCPAVPTTLCMPIINYIKEGSCLFMYYPDAVYSRMSLIG